MGNHENILNICDGRRSISEMVNQSQLPAGSMFFGLGVIFCNFLIDFVVSSF